MLNRLSLAFIIAIPSVSVAAETSPEEKKLTTACFEHGDCDPVQVYFAKKKMPSIAALYAKTGCEDFKHAKDCINYASYIGNQGFDEIGIGYLKTACKFDSKTCPSIDLIKCLLLAK